MNASYILGEKGNPRQACLTDALQKISTGSNTGKNQTQFCQGEWEAKPGNCIHRDQGTGLLVETGMQTALPILLQCWES